MVAGYRAGATIRALAGQFGVHEQTVRAHLRRRDVALRPIYGVRPEDIALVLEMHWGGVGEIKIARQLGVWQTSVGTALRRGGHLDL